MTSFEQQINTGTPPPCILECRERQGMVVIDAPLLFCGECPTAGGYPRKGIFCAPLQYQSSAYGYLHVSLPIDFIENLEEQNLFSAIAMNIGYALFNLGQQEQQRKAEDSLRLSEKRLRGITDSAQDAIIMMDQHGAISFWNPAAEKIFGYRVDEVLGNDLHTLLAPLHYQVAQQAAFPEFFQSGHGKAIGKTIELSALRKDGREIPVTLSLSALFQDGEWHAVGIVRDMTSYKLMEEQMMQAEKMSTIAGLAAGVAHEINTPLSAILQSIQVIQQSLAPDLAGNREMADRCGLELAKVQDYFEKKDINFFMNGIRESAIKSAKIISNLLQFSRPQKSDSSQEDLASLLDKSVELAKNDYDMRKNYNFIYLEIIRDYSPDLPRVSCVAMDIEQVFINLLKNAVQAMGDRAEPKPKARIILRTLLLKEIDPC
ncbi:MAG: PAS domain S-box protein [Desulfobulbaceae bacterium]